MLLTLFLTCFVSLVAATVLLLAFGDRVRVASRVLGLALGVVLAVAAGQAAARLWQLDPRPVLVAEALLVALTAVVVATRSLRYLPAARCEVGYSQPLSSAVRGASPGAEAVRAVTT
jgi:hypothetical protein